MKTLIAIIITLISFKVNAEYQRNTGSNYWPSTFQRMSYENGETWDKDRLDCIREVFPTINAMDYGPEAEKLYNEMYVDCMHRKHYPNVQF